LELGILSFVILDLINFIIEKAGTSKPWDIYC
jgi:hypothetical protein